MFFRKSALIGLTILPILFPLPAFGPAVQQSSLHVLLPQISGWQFSEPPRNYLPPTLFEYINGAAENYLSYAFQELIVADYKHTEGPATLTVEIYEMGSDRNAFGIYSSERFPQSRFLAIGNEAYHESGALNFVSGSKYVKLLCFDCGAAEETHLLQFAQKIDAGVKNKGSLPGLLRIFPPEGLVAHSEKFILHNVLGFAFFHDGFIASYNVQGREFDLFIIEGKDEKEAEEMLSRYRDVQKKNRQEPQTIPAGIRLKDRYADNVYLAQSGNLLLGVMRIPDTAEETGRRYLKALLDRARR